MTDIQTYECKKCKEFKPFKKMCKRKDKEGNIIICPQCQSCKYNSSNKEKNKKRMKKYYDNNKEKVKEYTLNYLKNNPEKQAKYIKNAKRKQREYYYRARLLKGFTIPDDFEFVYLERPTKAIK